MPIDSGPRSAALSSATPELNAEESAEPKRPDRSSARLHSLDALRGLAIVILLLAGNPFLREHLPVQLKHPEWHGLRFADVFFPLFLFVVGVAITLSRRAGSPRQMLRRVALLFLIGVALTSLKHRSLYLTGVLQHIAGAYLIAWLVLRAPRKLQPIIAAGILALLWGLFLLWGGPDPWSRERTAAHVVDGWLIGRFSTEGTLQTIASAVTVLGGAFAGYRMKERPDPRRLGRWIAGHALWLMAVGLALAPLIPINKRLWTPSFTLLTLGMSFAMFALFIWLIDVRRQRLWVTPMRELGANPIAIYIGYITVRALIAPYADAAPDIAPFGSGTAGALTYSLGWLIAGWLCARALYRRQIFLKI